MCTLSRHKQTPNSCVVIPGRIQGRPKDSSSINLPLSLYTSIQRSSFELENTRINYTKRSNLQRFVELRGFRARKRCAGVRFRLPEPRKHAKNAVFSNRAREHRENRKHKKTLCFRAVRPLLWELLGAFWGFRARIGCSRLENSEITKTLCFRAEVEKIEKT